MHRSHPLKFFAAAVRLPSLSIRTPIEPGRNHYVYATTVSTAVNQKGSHENILSFLRIAVSFVFLGDGQFSGDSPSQIRLDSLD